MTARRRQDLGIFGFALLIAAAVLFFATRSSPAYPINDWCDANIYLSIGKGMSQGQVVYRDLYDHKGPLLYFMHMLCAFIRFEDFFGVYVMETLLCASFLFLSHKVICLYGAKKAAWAALPVLALMVYTSVSFAEGDSAEEMCMPLMMGMIYLTLRFLRSGDASMKKGVLMMHGVLAGCIFWIKFTIMGVPAGLLLALFIRHAVRREWKECGRMVLWVAAGFVLSTVPWILYFGFTHGIGEWLGVYLYDNLFLYGGTGLGLTARIKTMTKLVLDWLLSNWRYTAVMALGLVWFIRRGWEGAAMWLGAGFGALVVYVGCVEFPYYGQALTPFAIAGVIPLCVLAEKYIGPRLAIALPAVLTAVCIALCPLTCFNMNADYGVKFGQPREETMHYQFAGYINQTENPVLVNYGFMDAGFFTAAGIAPQNLYFHCNNVSNPEMHYEQRRYIREGIADYVVTAVVGLPEMDDHYELIATAKTPDFWYEEVYLYRRKDLRDS